MSLKDEGIQRVKDNNPTDYQLLYNFAVRWVKARMSPFTSEDIKIDFENTHYIPKQPNIYGAAINSLAKAKLISEKGTTTAKLPSAHSRKISLWISTDYRLKQQNNRNAPYKDQLLLTLET